MAEGAVAGHFAFRTVALDAGSFGRHNGIRGIRTLQGVVAFGTGHAGVFRMIEVRPDHPTIGYGGADNLRRRDGASFNVMTCAASIESGAAIGRFAERGEEHFAFQVRAIDKLLAQAKHLLRDEVIYFRAREVGILLREFRVMGRQAAKESAHVLGASVRECECWIVLIKLQAMAGAAMAIVGDLLEKCAAGAGLMAGRAIEPLSIDQWNVVGLNEMALVIELERVGLA